MQTRELQPDETAQRHADDVGFAVGGFGGDEVDEGGDGGGEGEGEGFGGGVAGEVDEDERVVFGEVGGNA